MSITDGRRATDKHRAEIDEMIAAENDPRERLKLIMLAKMVDMLVSHADDLDDLKEYRKGEEATNSNRSGFRQVIAWAMPVVQVVVVGVITVLWGFMGTVTDKFGRLDMNDIRLEGRVNVTEVKLAGQDARIVHLEEFGDKKK
jgi:hypothetical protein